VEEGSVAAGGLEGVAAGGGVEQGVTTADAGGVGGDVQLPAGKSFRWVLDPAVATYAICKLMTCDILSVAVSIVMSVRNGASQRCVELPVSDAVVYVHNTCYCLGHWSCSLPHVHLHLYSDV
jgi:hypothetical protein